MFYLFFFLFRICLGLFLEQNEKRVSLLLKMCEYTMTCEGSQTEIFLQDSFETRFYS